MEKYSIQLNIGSLGGILLFGTFLLDYFTNNFPLLGANWLGVFIQIVIIYHGIKKIREDNYQGFIKYGKALKNGLFITLVYASFFAILVYIFATVIDDSFLVPIQEEKLKVIEMQKEIPFLSSGKFKEALEIEEERIKNLNIGYVAMEEFWFKLLYGSFVSLIIALILKKNPSPFDIQSDAN